MTELGITSDGLTAAQADEVLALVEAARLADGVAPLSRTGCCACATTAATAARISSS